ncbi:cell envelope integrity protein TolA [Arhodomonas sp. AD133]|uniref:cell envelope integrity protein TolA n=1 Tax=Arhodomonas sp. AD133 TaxID=3415009 RepID=UPI003EC0B5A5
MKRYGISLFMVLSLIISSAVAESPIKTVGENKAWMLSKRVDPITDAVSFTAYTNEADRDIRFFLGCYQSDKEVLAGLKGLKYESGDLVREVIYRFDKSKPQHADLLFTSINTVSAHPPLVEKLVRKAPKHKRLVIRVPLGRPHVDLFFDLSGSATILAEWEDKCDIDLASMAEKVRRREREKRLKEERQRRISKKLKEAREQYIPIWQQRIQAAWIRPPGISDGLSCIIQVRLSPSGVVMSARVVESSGDSSFDRSAAAAVQRAGMLPMPADSKIKRKFRQLRFRFKPET